MQRFKLQIYIWSLIWYGILFIISFHLGANVDHTIHRLLIWNSRSLQKPRMSNRFWTARECTDVQNLFFIFYFLKKSKFLFFFGTKRGAIPLRRRNKWFRLNNLKNWNDVLPIRGRCHLFHQTSNSISLELSDLIHL